MELLVLFGFLLVICGAYLVCLGVQAWAVWRIADTLEAAHPPAEVVSE